MRKKTLRFFYYLYLGFLLIGLSGCHVWPPLSYKTVDKHTAHPAAHYNIQLGLAYLEAGDRLQAKEKLLTAERQHPNASYIKSAIAYFLERIGEEKKAETYHLQALKLDPYGGSTHNNYGRFLCQCARYHEAETHFLKATQDPYYLNTASVYENLGLCAMRIPDPIKATHYLQIALKHNPRLEKSWLVLAQLHQLHQPKLAYAYLQRYEAIAVRHTKNALILGVELAQSLKHEKASRDYVLALKAQYPESPEYQQITTHYPQLTKAE